MPQPQSQAPNSPPDDASEAHELMMHRLWLQQPMTLRFFQSLEARAKGKCFQAARQSILQNPHEHNRLVAAGEILKIIEQYANPAQYPYKPSESATEPA